MRAFSSLLSVAPQLSQRLLIVGLSCVPAIALESRAIAAMPAQTVVAQEEPVTRPMTQPRIQPIAQGGQAVARVIYVDSRAGNDAGGGTFGTPLRTITQAIAAARPGMVIQLAPGTYSAETGEQFPIRIPKGVTLRGSESSRGQGIEIRGGGRFLSRTQAGQSVALVLENGAQVKGVTVSNSSTRGTGIWVEGGTASILSSTLTGSHREGVFLSGSSNVTVQGNVFYRNGGNGIAITKQSRGLIVGNVFEATGYGIAIGDQASPTLRNNRVVGNRDGIIINGLSRPILRGNTIENNQNDGVVVIGRAMPDLGTSGNPGANQIRGNGRNAVFNATRGKVPFPFYGNTVSGPAPAQVASAPIAPTPVPTPAVRPTAAPAPIIPVGETVPVQEDEGGWTEGPFFNPPAGDR